MLSFFRINDPYRLIIIAIILIAIRLVLFWGDAQVVSELHWMLIGESLNDGRNLYSDIWDNIPPFSATIYSLIDQIFGRSPHAYHIISIVLVLIQAFLFNAVLIKHKAFAENTYLPAFIYVILMNVFFDMAVLSPVLLSLIFIILAFDSIITHLVTKKDDQLIFFTGVYLGIATLFYYAAFTLLIATFASYLLLTGTSARRHLLLFFGFVMPIIITAIYFYLRGSAKEFYIDYILSIFTVEAFMALDFVSFISIVLIPLLFIIIAVVKTFSAIGYNNQQQRVQKVMFFMLALGIAAWFVNRERSPYQLTIFALPTAFFLTHFFLSIKKKWHAEVIFSVFLAVIIFANIATYKEYAFTKKIINFERLLVQKTDWDTITNEKKILVIGDDISAYKNATLATPYFNWQLSQQHLENQNYYDNITAIFLNFKNNLPEVIIDKEAVMENLQSNIPLLKSKYKKHADNVYVLR